MSEVLYRKYRPKNFSEVKGQDNIVKVLCATVLSKKPSHAYLFTGSRGTGKTSIARIFANAINCEKPSDNGDLCGKCRICKLIKSKNFLDIIEIDAASNRGINEIRDLKEKVAFSPVQGKYKVYIIDEVHMLTNEAFNALLKTLEEPPLHVIFLFATTEVQKLPSTILSRVVRFDVSLANQKDILKKLKQILKQEQVDYEEEALDILVRQARGSFRDAESLLEKVIKENQKITKKHINEILTLTSSKTIKELIMSLILSENLSETLEKIDMIIGKTSNLQYFLEEINSEVLGLIKKYFSKKKDEKVNFDIKKLFKFASVIQNLIVNYSQFFDPSTAIKLDLIKFAFNNLNNESNIKEFSQPKKQEKEINDKEENKKVKKTSQTSENKSIEKISQSDVDSDKSPLNRLIERVKEQNDRLAAFIGQSEITISENTCIIFVPYKFHLKQLEEIKNKQLIGKLVKELFGKNINLKIDISKKKIKKNIENKANNKKIKVIKTIKETKKNNEKMVEEIFSDIM